MGLCQLLKKRDKKGKFFLKHLEMEIELPPNVKVRYYPTLEGRIENSDKKSSDEILEEMTAEDRKKGTIASNHFVDGAVHIKFRESATYIDIILPSLLREISQSGMILGYLTHEFNCSHEEAHVLQYTLNYTKLAQFIEKYVGRNPYLNEIYQRARCFDGIDNNKTI